MSYECQDDQSQKYKYGLVLRWSVLNTIALLILRDKNPSYDHLSGAADLEMLQSRAILLRGRNILAKELAKQPSLASQANCI